MFPAQGLFRDVPCPDKAHCTRSPCLFSHSPTAKLTTVPVPVLTTQTRQPKASSSAPTSPAQPVASGSRHQAQSSQNKSSIIPTKRPVGSPLRVPGNTNGGGVAAEPPNKLQRVGTAQKSVAVPTTAHTPDGVPLLKINVAQSFVPLPVRQTMVKKLWEHFIVLYEQILERNPTLASEHTLRQEDEVYKKSTKLTYRNAVITTIASIKRRPKPDSVNHLSVGTEGDIAKREEELNKLQSLKLTPQHLEPYLLSIEDMLQWGYVVEIPPGEGGERPSEEGSITTCDRCKEPFMVKRKEEADECVFHWGKPFTSKANGEKRRVYTCCARTTDEEPCSKGPHVFYEKDPADLHRRHAFSHTRPAGSGSANGASSSSSTPDTVLDIVALDCEMIYSTGGMRVARVSVVDSMGKEVFDELVRMDDGVEVIDFNTRFSGITPEAYDTATMQLSSIRQALDSLINSETIIIGHALENDLKTLRMIHHKCVDTVDIFPHRSGAPYRRALRDLVKENLGRVIQAGGAAGHSSVEDSVATLELVRWHILNGPKRVPKPPTPVTSEPQPSKDNDW